MERKYQPGDKVKFLVGHRTGQTGTVIRHDVEGETVHVTLDTPRKNGPTQGGYRPWNLQKLLEK